MQSGKKIQIEQTERRESAKLAFLSSIFSPVQIEPLVWISSSLSFQVMERGCASVISFVLCVMQGEGLNTSRYREEMLISTENGEGIDELGVGENFLQVLDCAAAH